MTDAQAGEAGGSWFDADLIGANLRQAEAETDSFTPYRYRHFARCLGRTDKVLDLGCSTGRGGRVLRERLPGATLHGCDFLPDRLLQIPSGIYDELYAKLDHNLASGSYDAIVAGELIEHIPYRELEEFVGKLWLLLKPNGQLLLTTPNPHYLLLRWRGGSVLGGPHVSVHCPKALQMALAHWGFTHIWLRGTGRVSRLVGTRLPMALYGSYLLSARRGERSTSTA